MVVYLSSTNLSLLIGLTKNNLRHIYFKTHIKLYNVVYGVIQNIKSTEVRQNNNSK